MLELGGWVIEWNRGWGESRGRLGAMLELMVQDIGGFNAIYSFIGFSFGYFNLYFSSMKGVMMLRLFVLTGY